MLFLRYALFLPRFILNVLSIRDHVVIGISEPNLFITFLFLFLGKRNVKLYFPYDISFFRYHDEKQNFWYNHLTEGFNFKNADAILHKGPVDELQHLPDSYQIKDKPHLQFLPYCNKERMIDIKKSMDAKISKKQKGIHLVYVGGVIHHHPFDQSFIDTFQKIVDQKLYLHVYATNYSELVDDEAFLKLDKNEYFFLHQPIFGKDFQMELSKYDWGIYILYYNTQVRKELWVTTMFGNKVSDYLEAGIPIITNADMIFVAEILTKYQFGIVIDQPNQIRSALMEIDYEKFIEQLNHNRYKFTFEEKISKLEEFISTLDKT